MSNPVRERILNNLRNGLQEAELPVPEAATLPSLTLTPEEKIDRLKRLMEAVHTEVHLVHGDEWVTELKNLLKQKKLNRLVYAPGTPIGNALEANWENGLPPLLGYTEDIESFKETLFDSDASITSTRGGIAESGALILWPNDKEPRLMSLVPAVHIAILEADTIYNTFSEAMTGLEYAKGMPTNALLISGPSKTADIELTLTFGVHGPKELIVFIVQK
jgi:L-lactate dehydrogenase complex protein LldG